MENKRTGLRSLPVNVWIVTATSFLTDISSEMIVNLVPLFLANVLNAGTAVIGLIEGLAETTASVMKIYSGALSDKLGKRKWITVVGYALSTIAKPFMYFAATWEWVLGVRVADRLGKGIRTAPRDALVAGSIDEKQRGSGVRPAPGRGYCRGILRDPGRRRDRLADRGRGCRPHPPHLPDRGAGQHHPGDPGRDRAGHRRAGCGGWGQSPPFPCSA